MNRLVGVTAILCLITLVGACSTQTAAPPDQIALTTPTKEILVTDGDLNKAYDILGTVEYTLTGKSVYSLDSPETTKEVKDMLRRAAFAKYGERVDAILNVKTKQAVSGGFWGALAGGYGASTGSLHAEGVAVAFAR